jgi:hypothetical protein
MAHASKKHMGPGAIGKGDGSGSKTDVGAMPENMVLSNRDKSQHASGRARTQSGFKASNCTITKPIIWKTTISVGVGPD